MKKENSIRSLLGLRQEDMAMLLNISRAQWSMYESGKRELPRPAFLLLAELQLHVHSPETAAKRQTHLEKQQPQRQVQLERLLRTNEYQQLLLERKIAALEKKQEADIRLMHLADFLAQRDNEKEKTAGRFIYAPMGKISKAATKDHQGMLLEYEIKRELLVLEKMMLEAKMQKIELSLENKGDSRNE